MTRPLAVCAGLWPLVLVCTCFTFGCGSMLDVDKFHAASVDAGAADAAPSEDAGDDAAYTSMLTGFDYLSRECGQCVDTECADPMRLCLADPACSSYAGCLVECDAGPDCQFRCAVRIINARFRTAPGGAEILHCIDAQCSKQCGVSALGDDGESCGLLIDSPECARCCCEQERACFDSPACFRSQDCSPCDQTAFLRDAPLLADSCVQECIGEVPADDADWGDKRDALVSCSRTPRCSVVCSPQGEEWSCLGEVQWAAPSAGRVTMRIGVADFQDNQGLMTGVAVEQCYPTGDCAIPIATAVTDERGVATFELEPTQLLGLNNYYYRFPKIADDTYFPTNVMPFFPIATPFIHTALVTGREFAEAFAALNAVTIDLDRGLIAYVVLDCDRYPTSDSVFHLQLSEPQSDAVFVGLVDGAFAGERSDSVGFIYNVEPGATFIEHSFVDDRAKLVGRTPVIVRPGEVTIVTLLPTPL